MNFNPAVKRALRRKQHIAWVLLEAGADVNFMEAEDCQSGWRAPVIHDAVNAAVMCSRWNVWREDICELEVFSTQAQADLAFTILKRMVALGADLNAMDDRGNFCLWRFCLQARQISFPAATMAQGQSPATVS